MLYWIACCTRCISFNESAIRNTALLQGEPRYIACYVDQLLKAPGKLMNDHTVRDGMMQQVGSNPMNVIAICASKQPSSASLHDLRNIPLASRSTLDCQ